MKINTTVGEVLIHKGICFHENGNLKGFEPVEEISVESPIGTLNAFDLDPNGIHAESHSINFAVDGSIQSLITTSNQITVIKDGMKYKSFAPKLLSSYCNENALFISPLKILFETDSISFNNNNEPVESLSRFIQFKISVYVLEKPISCFGCE